MTSHVFPLAVWPTFCEGLRPFSINFYLETSEAKFDLTRTSCSQGSLLQFQGTPYILNDLHFETTPQKYLQKRKCTEFSYLRVDSDDFVALLAGVGEYGFVAFDAVGVVIAQHVPLASQRLVALPAAEMRRMPVLIHGLRELAAEN